MYKKLVMVLITLILFPCRGGVMAENVLELNSIMMKNTYKIEGDGSVGTCFLIGKPFKNDPKQAYYVLVTAAHVLEQMKGEDATIYLRKKQDNESFIKLPWKIKIRSGNNILWVKNASGVDVAAMYVALPRDIDVELLPISMLANDEILSKFEIHPGDEMCCLGFPFTAEANEAGFPILRSGTVASFPLVPTQKYKTFLLDFQVYKGNSGGPVYFIDTNRVYAGGVHLGKIQFIIGIVSREFNITETIKSLYKTEEQIHPLELAAIVPASHILDTINLLPDQEEEIKQEQK